VREQVPEMLQTMLAERFRLAYHRETREYKLTVESPFRRDHANDKHLGSGSPFP
jgi:uncharacterized protein (TIGR03435 family)